MKPEEYLDYLIAQRKNRPGQPLLLDDEVTASLHAAELLTRMSSIPVPPDFARRLEEKVCAHARMQRFSEQSGRLVLPINPQQRRPSHHVLRRRPWIVAIGSVAILLVVFTSLLTMLSYGLPGNSTPHLKTTQSQATPVPTNAAQSRAEEAIGQLDDALVNLNTVVRAGRDDKAIKQALNLVTTRTQNSQAAVAALPVGTQFQATQQHLAEELTEEKQTLSRLLNQVGWPIKLIFTQQLGRLGEAIPLVSHVVVRTLSDGVLGITLRGSNFALQGKFIVDGKHMGNIGQITDSQLEATITHTWWDPGTHTIGILNTDGTAAQIVYHSNNDGYEQPGTPKATPTRRPYDD